MSIFEPAIILALLKSAEAPKSQTIFENAYKVKVSTVVVTYTNHMIHSIVPGKKKDRGMDEASQYSA
jgi:hypothetical protein